MRTRRPRSLIRQDGRDLAFCHIKFRTALRRHVDKRRDEGVRITQTELCQKLADHLNLSQDSIDNYRNKDIAGYLEVEWTELMKEVTPMADKKMTVNKSIEKNITNEASRQETPASPVEQTTPEQTTPEVAFSPAGQTTPEVDPTCLDMEMTIGDTMKRSFLDNHYDSILTANREKILAGGNGDAFLGNALTDNRMALVVLIRIPLDIAEKINSCIDDLKGIEPNLYYYPAKDFHITVMDILKGEEGRRIPPNIIEYIHCIEECSKDISPFLTRFDGLTASDNAIMVRGYYDDQLMVFRQNLRDMLKQRDQLMVFRQNLRDMLKQRGLSLEERYKTISSHITIARLHSKFQNPEKLLDFIEKPRSFGTMTVSKMEISFHNWYDTRKEVLSILEL